MTGLLDADAIVRLLGAGAFPADAVADAIDAARGMLPEAADEALATAGLGGLADAVLLERQFGPSHFALAPSRRLYYRVRPLLPATARSLLRRGVVSRVETGQMLRWPVEDRFVSFAEQVRTLLDESNAEQTLPWWPSGYSFAVVLTHDVEGPFGLAHLSEVLSVEREAGFRSSISFVGDSYQVPVSLLSELRAQGFEIALHGWRHDGRDFSARPVFDERLRRMNERLRLWDAVGFRSPMTHRNPVWMQDLDLAWDSSFFDTDPYEPIAGGVMTIWPYVMGRFVELPYTLPQDHTLIQTLGETSPRIWIRKLDYIAEHHGMALVNTHPDYLCRNGRLRMYEEFLQELARRRGYWHALPREIAAWTRLRWSEGLSQPATTS